jgi:hypothetical protein
MAFERFDDAREVDIGTGRNLQIFAEIIFERGGFHPDAAASELTGEKAKVTVAGYENHYIRAEFHAKFHGFNGHHDVHVGFIRLLSGGAPLFAHDEKPFSFQPMQKTLPFLAELYPFVGHRRQPGVNERFDHVPIFGEKLAKFEPVDRPVQLAADASEVAFINEYQGAISNVGPMVPCRHPIFPSSRIMRISVKKGNRVTFEFP